MPVTQKRSFGTMIPATLLPVVFSSLALRGACQINTGRVEPRVKVRVEERERRHVCAVEVEVIRRVVCPSRLGGESRMPRSQSDMTGPRHGPFVRVSPAAATASANYRMRAFPRSR
ncbi:hypothetical protein HPB50_026501 [Hyalomma asiaticum]|uniref:Uncharacterized protein n=1 Tax=Hyalomma asiaticum TaxID=266040 RepID=A0ACB7SQQ8_HYAAI|nr:hypothetical protein HPB50_026501 [Hyalomma asiaticum]